MCDEVRSALRNASRENNITEVFVGAKLVLLGEHIAVFFQLAAVAFDVLDHQIFSR